MIYMYAYYQNIFSKCNKKRKNFEKKRIWGTVQWFHKKKKQNTPPLLNTDIWCERIVVLSAGTGIHLMFMRKLFKIQAPIKGS